MWLVFNVAIALLLMELGIDQDASRASSACSMPRWSSAWVGAHRRGPCRSTSRSACQSAGDRVQARSSLRRSIRSGTGAMVLAALLTGCLAASRCASVRDRAALRAAARPRHCAFCRGAGDRLGDRCGRYGISPASRSGRLGCDAPSIACSHLQPLPFEGEDMSALPGLCRRRSARCAVRWTPAAATCASRTRRAWKCRSQAALKADPAEPAPP